MKKMFAIFLAISLLITVCASSGETSGNPPEPPAGGQGGTPPTMQNGQPPEKPDGDGTFPGNPPDGNGAFPGNPPDSNGGATFGGGMPGGMGQEPESYTALNTISEDMTLSGQETVSTGADENALLVTGGNVIYDGGTVQRVSADSTGGDTSSFYGVGAAFLVTGGTLTVSNTEIKTDSAGGAGVFAYGNGTAYVNDCVITTAQGTSGGIHVAGGGKLYAKNLTVVTNGSSSAAIRSDRGGGTLVAEGGSYTANGEGSPAVYVTADITVTGADLAATGSEALCLEGKNSVTLTDCHLSGNMPDLSQNDNTWTVIVYQSMSGDAQTGLGTFTMSGGSLTSGNGGLFYTTNTDSVFTLNHVELISSEGFEYLLRCTGNQNQRGWGQSGANGANCTFLAADQTMSGTILWDSISNLTLCLTEGSVYTGAVLNDESCAGAGGNGSCGVSVDASSRWIVTADSYVTALDNQGTVCDADGKTVSVVDAVGNTLVKGDSAYTVYLMETGTAQ